MCGIAGFFDIANGVAGAAGEAVLRAMTDALRHRGPDAFGSWLDPETGLGLGHRRLSILDLSQAGSQPMTSHDGRYVLCFNGEIYNFVALRREVEERRGGVIWRGRSDTEVLLELVSELGPEAAFTRLDGMFALALYDRRRRQLTLARDPFGEKPLYYGYCRRSLIFASELTAVQRYPGFAGTLNEQAAVDFFKYSYVPAPATIWRGIFKLPPACFVELSSADIVRAHLPEPRRYWDMQETALAARNGRAPPPEADRMEMLRALLLDATRRRMMSDVPLGALLSGGIDSSLVTALMQANAEKPIRTFSIGSDDKSYDEAGAAKAVSEALGTDHTELILSAVSVQDVVPLIATLYDEPFADSSQLPTYLVSKLAREHVTVALSGDGGDELFGGYNRYIYAPRVWRRIALMPTPLRRAASAALSALPLHAVNRAVSAARRLAPKELAHGPAAEKLHKLARILDASNESDFHDGLLATTSRVQDVVLADVAAQAIAAQNWSRAGLSFAERAMLVDTGNYLPDDVLTKVDRASMAVSLEVRTPFLNKALFAFAWQLPPAARIAGDQGKRILRELLYSYVPRALVDRPKTGFAVPIGRWLRSGRIRDWAETLLDERAVRDTGILNAAEVRRRWHEHVGGQRDHASFLWSVLMFQGWRASTARTERNADRPAAA
jgi:asparagine synthase (glutamine-hydrolysing)